MSSVDGLNERITLSSVYFRIDSRLNDLFVFMRGELGRLNDISEKREEKVFMAGDEVSRESEIVSCKGRVENTTSSFSFSNLT